MKVRSIAKRRVTFTFGQQHCASRLQVCMPILKSLGIICWLRKGKKERTHIPASIIIIRSGNKVAVIFWPKLLLWRSQVSSDGGLSFSPHSLQKDVNLLDFRVDEKLIRVKMNGGEKGINFNFNQPLYLGGFLLNTFSAEKGFLSKMGFQGCLASLSFSAGKITNALEEGKVLKEFKNDIVRGCAASGARCRPTSCHYDGHCIQQWTQTRCNCEMTSFIGKYCSNGKIFCATRESRAMSSLTR